MGLNPIRWFHGNHRRAASLHKATCHKTPSRRLAVEPIETRLLLSATFQSGMELVLADNNVSADLLVITGDSDSGFRLSSTDSVTDNAVSWQSSNDGSQVIVSFDKPTTHYAPTDLPTTPLTFIRISDPELPIGNRQTQMIDLAMNADTPANVIETFDLSDTSNSSELVEDSQPAEDQPESVKPSMTVEGTRGRGQFFELAMATDAKPGLASPRASSELPDKLASVVSQERLSTTNELPVQRDAIRWAGTSTRVSPPTNQAELVFSGSPPSETLHQDESVFCAPENSRSPLHDSISNGSELAVAALAPQIGAAETEEPQHDAVFAELNQSHDHEWLEPLYLDKKSHVDLAVGLVATVAAAHMIRRQEQQSDPGGTYLLPQRRHDWWFKFH